MSERQANFIRSLKDERDLTSLTDEQRAWLETADLETVSSTVARRIIDTLTALPRRPRRTVADRSSVEAGFYCVFVFGQDRFYRVSKPTEGRWAGRTFLDEIIGGDRRKPIRDFTSQAHVFGHISRDPQAARARYGREIGRCGYCNRSLTDETSRICGIGPDCARQHDVDREGIVASLLVKS